MRWWGQECGRQFRVHSSGARALSAPWRCCLSASPISQSSPQRTRYHRASLPNTGSRTDPCPFSASPTRMLTAKCMGRPTRPDARHAGSRRLRCCPRHRPKSASVSHPHAERPSLRNRKPSTASFIRRIQAQERHLSSTSLAEPVLRLCRNTRRQRCRMCDPQVVKSEDGCSQLYFAERSGPIGRLSK